MTGRITIFTGKLAHLNSPNANGRIYEKPESLQRPINEGRTIEDIAALNRELLNLISCGVNVGKSNFIQKQTDNINWKHEGF